MEKRQRKYHHKVRSKGLKFYCQQYKETGKVDDKCLEKYPFFIEIFEQFGEEWYRQRKYRSMDVFRAYQALKNNEIINIKLDNRFYSIEELKEIMKENNIKFLTQLNYEYKQSFKMFNGVKIRGFKIYKKNENN